MSFFDDASLAFLPSGAAGKDGKAYSIKPTDGTGDFTFSRGSNLAATRVGADGLIEKGRENLLTYSNDFSNADWTKQDVSVTSGQSGYDGSSDAWLLSKSAASGRIYQNISVSNVATYSVYAKANSVNWILIYTQGGSNPRGYFDLVNGVIGANNNLIDYNIVPIGSDGWYRISITHDTTISNIRIFPADADDDLSGTSGSVYIQDAQAEIGLAATDYIESGATTGKAGLLEDEPRFDYSGGATCGSLLLEPSRTNLFTQSEYITNAIRATITHNQAISPEGLQNAFLVVDSTDLNNHQFATGAPSLFNFGGTDTVVFSVFAKKQNNRYINLRINDNAANVGGTLNYYNATFDLEGGVVTADFEYGTPTSPFSDIEDYGNGWFRCWVGLTKKSGVTRTDVSGYLVNSSAAIDNPAYAGTGNDGNYLYGFQIEAGSYPTSYIPNHSGGSVTRGLDEVDLTGASSLIGQTEGTLFLDWEIIDGIGDRYIALLSVDNRILFYRTNAGVRVQITANASTIYNSATLNNIDGRNKLAVSYTSGDIKVYLNGSEAETSTATFTFSNPLSDFDFQFAAKENKTRIYQCLTIPEALSGTDLATLTTI